MILHNYHRYIQPDWLYNLENKTEILPAVPPLMSLVSVLLLLAQTGLSSSRSGLQCYVGNCSSWEDCRRPGLITDCPPDHHYTACLTFIDQKCKLLLRVSSLSSIFAVCKNFKITIEQLMYRHQHKSLGLWSRNFKSQYLKIVKVSKVIRLECSLVWVRAELNTFLHQELPSLSNPVIAAYGKLTVVKRCGSVSLCAESVSTSYWWSDECDRRSEEDSYTCTSCCSTAACNNSNSPSGRQPLVAAVLSLNLILNKQSHGLGWGYALVLFHIWALSVISDQCTVGYQGGQIHHFPISFPVLENNRAMYLESK